MLSLQFHCDIDQGTENDRAIVIGEVNQASLGDKTAKLDQLPRAFAPLHLPIFRFTAGPAQLQAMSCGLHSVNG